MITRINLLERSGTPEAQRRVLSSGTQRNTRRTAKGAVFWSAAERPKRSEGCCLLSSVLLRSEVSGLQSSVLERSGTPGAQRRVQSFFPFSFQLQSINYKEKLIL